MRGLQVGLFFLVDGVVFEMCRNSPDLVVGLLANCVVLEFGRGGVLDC